MTLNTIEEAIADIKLGKLVIVVDDEDRENEGDFIGAAQLVNEETINFMATHGRGLICAPIEERRASQLKLEPMVNRNTALHETAFTVSIDLIGQGCTTGISAYDRAHCMQALVDESVLPHQFARPGHIFPLIAKDGGVLRRTGHTEAAIDLARLAGLYPAGILVEILNEDGSMARLPQLFEVAKVHDLKIVSIKDLVEYRMQTESIIQLEMETQLDSRFGMFTVKAYRQKDSQDIHIALIKGEIVDDEPTLVRVHSRSATGDLLGILFDDHGKKLFSALEKINEVGKGVLLLMRQNGESDNILDMLRKIDVDPANDPLPSEIQRDYGVGAQILRDIGIQKMQLITSNDKRRIGLVGYGLEVVDLVKI